MSQGELRTTTESAASSTTGKMEPVSMFQPSFLKKEISLAQGKFTAWENRLKHHLGFYNIEPLLTIECLTGQAQKDSFSRLDNFAKLFIMHSVNLLEVQDLHNFGTSKEMLKHLKSLNAYN